MTTTGHGAVVALAGGVGGARLVDGLDQALPPGALQVVANTGDDFQHWGLHISPDLDTLMYTLAGLSPEDRGWGIEGDSFHALGEARRRGLDDWFQLGDRDLVTHLVRTAALARGESLTEVTQSLCRALDVDRVILPMSDTPRPTTISSLVNQSKLPTSRSSARSSQLRVMNWLPGPSGGPHAAIPISSRNTAVCIVVIRITELSTIESPRSEHGTTSKFGQIRYHKSRPATELGFRSLRFCDAFLKTAVRLRLRGVLVDPMPSRCQHDYWHSQAPFKATLVWSITR